MQNKYTWIVIKAFAVGEAGFEINYDSDKREFDDKAQAVSYGFHLRESDDFNLGLLNNGKLDGFWWMDQELKEPKKVMQKIATALNLELSNN